VSTELAVPPGARVIDVGFKLETSPDGETEAARFTVPLKLLRLVRLMLDVPHEPWLTLRLLGAAESVKSGAAVPVTVNETFTE